ncbi:hypothetical protein FAGAP_12352 [Fusarium agapanthi]|uniref:Uncharacterized protein n=1 Tax=Fusarium agapanthi TaxID=1803897 RepID=A0A9P5B3X2_9HYPO|nr:hypothetical protein FAGAP_12352 [Fusarium agapanthi]
MMLKYLTKPTRKNISDALLILGVIGSVISVILASIVFIAGTTVIRGDPDHLLWKPLALVSFEGIIPNNDTSHFLVHLNWFASSFGWEYPTAPKGLPKVGITSSGLRYHSNIVNDLNQIATELRLPEDTFNCPKPGPYEDPCGNIFFEAWRSYMASGGLPISSWIVWINIYVALVFSIMDILREWVIPNRPHWMKCRCIIGKRWCPLPKGSKEEIEQFDDYVWDKVRLTYWAVSAAYFGIAAGHTCLNSVFFVRYLGYFEERLPDGISMHGRRRLASEILLWVAFGIKTFGALCMAVRWKLSRRPEGWMDGQSLGRLERTKPNGADGGKYTD